MASITMRNLVKNYGNVTVIPGLDLEIADEEFIVLVGPSGCGKSTLLRVLAGLEAIDGGDLMIGDRRVNELPAAKRDIAMVFQDYALYPHMTVRQNMAFALEMRGLSAAEIAPRIEEAAKLLDIQPYLDRRPKALSGGQRQRVAMGRAIVRDPQVFLFDEPLSNLDAKLRGQVRAEIKTLSKKLRTTMVFVTHDQIEAMTMADRIVVMKAGIIQQVGTPEEVYENPANLFVASFIGSPSMNFLPVEVQADQLRLVDGSLLPTTLMAGQAAGHKSLTLGIRPEHFEVVGEGQGIAADIRLVEPLGSDTLVHAFAAGQEVIARVSPDLRPVTGQRLWLSPASGKAHLFDPETEVRIDGTGKVN
ncbi:ABC transporter ATP-binding protein [Paracoccus alkanivorans]|uniref:sn-glycerol-3-phosphate ABC transporter ATP-binding protein UgpC n=1 Tax=Paracoccus alkanivorans TaxID=2116655 RepID=A0A3M0MER3_9RHOB|nr:sn-glycerol-3-phosphate ABC transporter ATP-binding protein UgpC [Paracoccus alkanivorans]RMC36232.1 sn-glycerol-3-phosphate ABC transporter ATP-binding protein UgpC [Paracoccus alkanivorans]